MNTETFANTFYRRITRARYHARGLNSCGRPRRKKQFPELAGLSRREWRRRYMRLRRATLDPQPSTLPA